MRARIALALGIATVALVACSGEDGSPTATYLRQVRASVPGDAGLADAPLLERAHAICDHLRPGDPRSWRLTVSYLATQGIPAAQAYREIDFASALYCAQKRSSLSRYAPSRR